MHTIQIDLRDYRSTLGEYPIYYPGDRVSGQVVIYTESRINCRNVRVDVGWMTQGKGNQDKEAIQQYVIDVQQIEPGMPISQKFSADLPPMPYSFNGELINIVWGVQVTIDIARRPDINESRQFIVRPPEKRSSD